MRFLENGENVVFLGPPGVGKTHLASALGLVAAQHRFSTYYINCHQLIEQLKKAHFENCLPDKLKSGIWSWNCKTSFSASTKGIWSISPMWTGSVGGWFSEQRKESPYTAYALTRERGAFS